MSTKEFTDYVPETFAAPEQIPASPEEAEVWQQTNRNFWESNPMRYDWRSGIAPEPFSKEFYEEIDRRFFDSVREYMPWKKIPFDAMVDFDALKSKSVLEIGVGMGTHAQLLSTHAGSYTGIDLTEYAVEVTSKRLKLFGIDSRIQRMDAEKMDFPDATFDTVWSWGVIHHSSNTAQILREIHRVLKPGGEAIVMVYHRGWFNYYLVGGLLHGMLRGGLRKHGSLHKTVQSVTDGAIARYYTGRSWRRAVRGLFRVDYVIIKGNKAEVFPIPASKAKSALMRVVPDFVTRAMTNPLRMGSFLISRMVKDK